VGVKKYRFEKSKFGCNGDMKLIKTINTANNIIYIYKINNKLFAFKPSENTEREILANKLARLFRIKTLKIKPFEIDNKKGIIMNYLKEGILLTNYSKELNIYQIKQLKRIILFDIWIGNKDRHTGNIFVSNNLTIFDHENIFNKDNARKSIKLDIGRRLNKNYVEIIEKILDKNLTVVQVLKKLGFTKKDFINLEEKDVRKIVKNKDFCEFLVSRMDFSKIKF